MYEQDAERVWLAALNVKKDPDERELLAETTEIVLRVAQNLRDNGRGNYHPDRLGVQPQDWRWQATASNAEEYKAA